MTDTPPLSTTTRLEHSIVGHLDSVGGCLFRLFPYRAGNMGTSICAGLLGEIVGFEIRGFLFPCSIGNMNSGITNDVEMRIALFACSRPYDVSAFDDQLERCSFDVGPAFDS